jgi:tRNA G18 (ribose-2'-O)-methylase SpoU
VDPAADLVAAVSALGAPVYVAPPGALEELTGYQVHRGLLAAMNRRPLPKLAQLLPAARRVAVLEDVVDHTNCGAAFRSAAAFGVDAVLITPSCADPLYRRAVRTSMGAVFVVPWTRLSAWPGDLVELHDAGFVTAALTPDPAATDLREFAAHAPERLALVFGTEGDGLRPDTLGATTVRVRIPMAGGLDSLNVAAAAAVAFFATAAGKE